MITEIVFSEKNVRHTVIKKFELTSCNLCLEILIFVNLTIHLDEKNICFNVI